VVERLTGHERHREKRGGANTTGTVTIEKSTLVRVAESYELGPMNPLSLRDRTCGAPRSGGVRAATRVRDDDCVP
jgi:hypothetical protein